MNFNVPNVNGTLEYRGVVNGVDNIIKTGLGTLLLSTANSTMTGTWEIKNGALSTASFPGRLGSNRPITLGDDGLATLRIIATGNYSGSITINANDGILEYDANANRTFSGIIAFGANDLLINNISATRTLTLSGDQTGSGRLTINNAGVANVILTAAAYSRTGYTILQAGTLRLTPPSAGTTFNSKIVFNGGTLSTVGITDSRTFTSTQPIQLQANSALILPNNRLHTLTFADSSLEIWSGTLTITGWLGVPGTAGAGTQGRIFIGNSNTTLTPAQLASINFVGFDLGAALTSAGELVPSGYFAFYTIGSGNANTLANYNTRRDGSGTAPASFTIVRASYIVQNGHTMTTSAAWTVNGANNSLIIEEGGVIQADHTITIAATTNFSIEDNGRFINNINNLNILNGVENFEPNSFFEMRNWTNGNITAVTTGFGNLIFNGNTTNALSFNNTITLIRGNLEISNTSTGQISLCTSAGTNPRLIVEGNFILNAGIFNITNGTVAFDLVVNGNVQLNNTSTFRFQNASTGVGRLVLSGENFSVSGTMTLAGLFPGNSGFYFNFDGIQNVTIGQAFTAGNFRNRFFYNSTLTTLNEIYNGTVAQQTVNGSDVVTFPIVINSVDFFAWPLSGTGINNLTINNSSATGVTLRDARTVNNTLTLSDGLLYTGACNAATSGTPLLTMAAGSDVSGGSTSSYVSGVMRKVGHTAFVFPVGDNSFFAPISISGASAATDFFTTCYSRTNPLTTFGTAKTTSVNDITNCEHWHLNSTPAGISTQITLDINNSRCPITSQFCKKVIGWSGSTWQSFGNAADSSTFVQSMATTFRGPMTWSSNLLSLNNHNTSIADDFTKVGIGTHATMKAGFPTNLSGGLLAFDSDSRGMVIPRVNNASRPAGAAGLLIYNTDSNCIQWYNGTVWKCIEPSCGN